jgi:DNA-binding NtrC family response regulator
MARRSQDNAARRTPDVPCDWTEEPEPAQGLSTTATGARAPRLALPVRRHLAARTASVLIVDDDVAAGETFAQALRLEGYEVLTALSAESGLRAVQTSCPDVILVDFRMPLASGVEFLRQLRAGEWHSSTPVAVVTGDYTLDDTITSELHKLGATVAFKPLWLAELVDLTRTLLAGRPSRP